MKAEKWVTDLTVCEPRSAIHRDSVHGKWIEVDYELGDLHPPGQRGTMLFGLPDSDAPRLRIPLEVEGFHEIRLGIFYGTGAGILEDRVLLVKLSGDPAYSRIYRENYERKDGQYPEKALRWLDVSEVLWKRADLSGQEILISRPTGGEESLKETNLTYVRLVPMDDGARRELSSELPRAETRRLIANFDGGNLRRRGVCDREDFLSEFQVIRDSDFDIVLHAMARGSITLYPSKVGEFARPVGFHGGGHLLHRCVEKGLDPLAEVIRAAHECGLKLFPQNRLVGVQIPPKHIREDYGGRLMKDHPEWRCRYGDGEPLRHLSMAFEGVRDFHVRLMREWVQDYQADGVNLLFSRSYPFVYYEEPVCKRFEEVHGEDMRDLDPGDERVQRIRATFMTQLLREIRCMLDEVGEDQGRYIPNCYLVPVRNSPENLPESAYENGLEECLFNALDVGEWIREGLVDNLVVHLHMFEKHDGTTMQSRVHEFTDLARSTRTKVFIDIYPRRMPPCQYRKIAMSYYAAGADGLAFWDFQNRYPRASEVAFIKRLGHVDDLSRWEGKGDDYHRVVPLSRLDGFLTTREFARPHDG